VPLQWMVGLRRLKQDAIWFEHGAERRKTADDQRKIDNFRPVAATPRVKRRCSRTQPTRPRETTRTSPVRPSVALDRDQTSRCPSCFRPSYRRGGPHLTRSAAATYPASTTDSFDVTTLQFVAGRSRRPKCSSFPDPPRLLTLR